MKSVLITGAAGFIGRQLSARFAEEGWRVKGGLRQGNDLAGLQAGIEPTVVGQIDAQTDWTYALQGVDTIVHLAARVHVIREQSPEPLAEFRRVNVTGTERLLNAAVRSGIKRFLFMSSIGVNGDRTIGRPFTESDEPRPATPYAISKCEAERAVRRIGEDSGMEWVVIRPPLVYGPGNPGNMLSLFHLVARRVPLPLASVSNRRSFIGLSNLVDAVYRCASAECAAGNIYLVSDGEEVSTPEMIRRIGYALGIRARLFPFPLLLMKIMGDITGNRSRVDQLTGCLTVDSGKIRNDLQWVPPLPMNSELRKTAEWYRLKYPGRH